jgi:predicted DNA-binding protein (MmcQ/YjbR family)
MAPRRRRVRPAIVEFALSLPEARLDQPWEDDDVAKVAAKIFAFLGDETSTTLAVKLPESADHALSIPGARPTAYGLGKHGWVTVPIDHDDAPLELLLDWVEESYRAVAPKRLVRLLDADAGAERG